MLALNNRRAVRYQRAPRGHHKRSLWAGRRRKQRNTGGALETAVTPHTLRDLRDSPRRGWRAFLSVPLNAHPPVVRPRHLRLSLKQLWPVLLMKRNPRDSNSSKILLT